MNNISRRLASSTAILSYLFLGLVALQAPLSRPVILAVLAVALVAEVIVQRSSEFGLPFVGRELDERQEAQRAQLLATSYRVALVLALASLVIFALAGPAFLWMVGRSGQGFIPEIVANAVRWGFGLTFLGLVLLPGHVAAWQTPAESQREVNAESA